MWFSAGVSSAVAAKLVLPELAEIIYTHIDDQHEDTLRFLHDCEKKWFGRPITILQSQYKTVEAAVEAGGSAFVNGPTGAICTRWLKRRVRQDWEAQYSMQTMTYFWGLDVDEKDRADRLCETMPYQQHRFPLIEAGLTKAHAHGILAKAGIRRPMMYDLGFHNNNCIGCVKGGMGYWNMIRVVFPQVFASRAAMERRIGGSCINGTYLDELDPKRGRHEGPICPECGIACELLTPAPAGRGNT